MPLLKILVQDHHLGSWKKLTHPIDQRLVVDEVPGVVVDELRDQKFAFRIHPHGCTQIVLEGGLELLVDALGCVDPNLRRELRA